MAAAGFGVWVAEPTATGGGTTRTEPPVAGEVPAGCRCGGGGGTAAFGFDPTGGCGGGALRGGGGTERFP